MGVGCKGMEVRRGRPAVDPAALCLPLYSTARACLWPCLLLVLMCQSVLCRHSPNPLQRSVSQKEKWAHHADRLDNWPR